MACTHLRTRRHRRRQARIDSSSKGHREHCDDDDDEERVFAFCFPLVFAFTLPSGVAFALAPLTLEAWLVPWPSLTLKLGAVAKKSRLQTLFDSQIEHRQLKESPVGHVSALCERSCLSLWQQFNLHARNEQVCSKHLQKHLCVQRQIPEVLVPDSLQKQDPPGHSPRRESSRLNSPKPLFAAPRGLLDSESGIEARRGSPKCIGTDQQESKQNTSGQQCQVCAHTCQLTWPETVIAACLFMEFILTCQLTWPENVATDCNNLANHTTCSLAATESTHTCQLTWPIQFRQIAVMEQRTEIAACAPTFPNTGDRVKNHIARRISI